MARPFSFQSDRRSTERGYEYTEHIPEFHDYGSCFTSHRPWEIQQPPPDHGNRHDGHNGFNDDLLFTLIAHPLGGRALYTSYLTTIWASLMVMKEVWPGMGTDHTSP